MQVALLGLVYAWFSSLVVDEHVDLDVTRRSQVQSPVQNAQLIHQSKRHPPGMTTPKR